MPRNRRGEALGKPRPSVWHHGPGHRILVWTEDGVERPYRADCSCGWLAVEWLHTTRNRLADEHTLDALVEADGR